MRADDGTVVRILPPLPRQPAVLQPDPGFSQYVFIPTLLSQMVWGAEAHACELGNGRVCRGQLNVPAGCAHELVCKLTAARGVQVQVQRTKRGILYRGNRGRFTSLSAAKASSGSKASSAPRPHRPTAALQPLPDAAATGPPVVTVDSWDVNSPWDQERQMGSGTALTSLSGGPRLPGTHSMPDGLIPGGEGTPLEDSIRTISAPPATAAQAWRHAGGPPPHSQPWRPVSDSR